MSCWAAVGWRAFDDETTVTWSQDGLQLGYYSSNTRLNLNIVDLGTWARSIEDQLCCSFRALLPANFQFSQISTEAVFRNNSHTSASPLLYDDKQGAELQHIINQLWKAYQCEEVLFSGGGSEVIASELWILLEKEQRFLEVFVVYLAVASGNPPDPQGFSDLRIQEVYSLPRSFYRIGQDLVVAVPSTRSRSQNPAAAKLLPLCPRISILMTSYISCVRPVLLGLSLRFVLAKDLVHYQGHLFAGIHGRWNIDRFNTVLAAETIGSPIQGLKLGDIRLVFQQIHRRQFNIDASAEVDAIPGNLAAVNHQGDHTNDTVSKNYGIDGSIPFQLSTTTAMVRMQTVQQWAAILGLSAASSLTSQETDDIPILRRRRAIQRMGHQIIASYQLQTIPGMLPEERLTPLLSQDHVVSFLARIFGSDSATDIYIKAASVAFSTGACVTWTLKMMQMEGLDARDVDALTFEVRCYDFPEEKPLKFEKIFETIAALECPNSNLLEITYERQREQRKLAAEMLKKALRLAYQKINTG
jgi:hypothetical protein